MAAKPPIPGFGPVCSPELRAVGIDSVDRIRELGWEEAFLRWVEAFPSRINVNAAVGMIAAEKGVPWQAIAGTEKEVARKMVARLRIAQSPTASRPGGLRFRKPPLP
ncbi:MAG: TfoX/Sxy family DNA transformation protein [Bryobacteraceae bacterium]